MMCLPMVASLPVPSLQIAVGVVTVITIPAVAPVRQPASWVFGSFNTDLAVTNLPSSVRDIRKGEEAGRGG